MEFVGIILMYKAAVQESGMKNKDLKMRLIWDL